MGVSHNRLMRWIKLYIHLVFTRTFTFVSALLLKDCVSSPFVNFATLLCMGSLEFGCANSDDGYGSNLVLWI